MPQRARTRRAASRGQRAARPVEAVQPADEVPNDGTPSKAADRFISGESAGRRTRASGLDGDTLERRTGPSSHPHKHHWPPTGRTQLAHHTKTTLASTSSHLSLFIITSLLHLFIATDEASQLAQRPTFGAAYSAPSSAHFPSARHFYHRSVSVASASEAPTSATLPPNVTRLRRRDRISSLHEQLNQLRRQLETELRVGGEQEEQKEDTSDSNQNNAKTSGQKRPPVQLGAPCLSSADCAKSISNAHCSAANFTCVCLDQHVPINASTCLAPSLLGYECQLDAQCQQKVAHSLCLSNKCACPPDSFVAHRRNKCLAASKLNDYCLSDGQCQLNERHSFCKWKIPNVYGTCKCPPNYKLLPGSNSVRCAPRLGDACFSDAECQLATPHSTCRAPQSGASPATRGLLAQLAALKQQASHGSTWPTSGASTLRCTCAEGFVWSASQLDCEPAATKAPPTSTSTTGSSSVLQDTHKYEMIVIAAGGEQQAGAPGDSSRGFESNRTTDKQFAAAEEQLDIKILDSARTPASSTPAATSGGGGGGGAASTPPTTTSTTARSISASEWYENQTTTMRPAMKRLRMSSLGKSCESRAECQLRDPHSDCIAGRCECQVPTARCRANSTGCHKETFQCRNGQCISWYFVCDQFPNCDDASDELDCQPNNCPRESFQCLTGGACVARAKLCDGKRDCADASDERHCQPGAANFINMGQQHPASLSLSASFNSSTLGGAAAASGLVEKSSSPAAPATLATARCHPDAFTCRNGRQCLPAYVFCNAVPDCADGSDEDELLCERPRAQRRWLEHLERELANRKSATTSSLAPSKMDLEGLSSKPAAGDLLRLPAPAAGSRAPAGPSSQEESPLVKTDRASIERLRAALALADRTPESRGRPQGQRRAKLLDEQPAARPPDECPRWAFTCANGKCRSSAILCSGVDGCGDNSDEDRCEVCHCQPPT